MDQITAANAEDMLRRNDAAEMRAAYARIPPVVLLSIMEIAGIGMRRPTNLSAEGNAYENGMQALAIEILERAGFDATSIRCALITGLLKGKDHERHDDERRPILDAGGGYEPNPEY